MTVALCPNCFKELSDLKDKEDRIDYFCDYCNKAIKENEIIENILPELVEIKEQVKLVIDFVIHNNLRFL